jgi:hypothetical protein
MSAKVSVPTMGRSFLLQTALFLLAAGCGHAASRAECDEILDKSAELELRAQNVNDPAEIRKRTEAVRAARGEALLKHCVGRQITDRAMQCVRRATTAPQVDKCLE